MLPKYCFFIFRGFDIFDLLQKNWIYLRTRSISLWRYCFGISYQVESTLQTAGDNSALFFSLSSLILFRLLQKRTRSNTPSKRAAKAAKGSRSRDMAKVRAQRPVSTEPMGNAVTNSVDSCTARAKLIRAQFVSQEGHL